MRLAAARARMARLEFARPVFTSHGEFTSRGSVILALEDLEGRCGYGEAAPWPGFGTESEAQALAALEDVAELLAGADVEPGECPVVAASRLGNAPAARAALEGALWDLAARRAGRSLAAHLVESCVAPLARRDGVADRAALGEVPVSALLIERSPDALRREAASVRAAGYRAAKMKLGGGSLDEDCARARAAREGLGEGFRLRGDANGAWTESDARQALQSLAEFGFEYLEQPVAPGDEMALARLRRLGLVRIAADESVATGRDARRLVESGAVDVLVLKPAMLGGPARALEIANLARRSGCDVVFSHAFESAVGARHALHCAAAWADPVACHGLCTAGLFVNDIAEPVACRKGVAVVASSPGLGITL
ncbi:MAG: o-succinylbenzoate synthase [Steroidobacteraceae bacterium]|nr:o-succinylbenzoate synthase [Steroidobacteraceae bacterium]